MPRASAITATFRPIAPRPTTTIVLPASSVNGVSQKQKCGLLAQRPARTAAPWWAVWLVSSSSIAMVACATEPVP
jgi:hypothetical protein